MRLVALASLLVLLSVAQARAWPHAEACPPLVVCDFGDAPPSSDFRRNPGPVGSLRYIVLRVAKPGDTIRFQSAGTVRLNGALRIRRELSGLTIDGAVGGANAALQYGLGQRNPGQGGGSAGALSSEASGVTIRNLVFNDASAYVGGPNAGVAATGVRVEGNRFVGPRSELFLMDLDRSVVRDNVFEERQAQAMTLLRVDRVVVDHNTFANGGTGISALAGINVVVRDNTFRGGRNLLQANALTVEENRLEDARLEIGDAGDERHLVVRENRGTGHISVDVGKTGVVNRNVLTGGDGIHVTCIERIFRGASVFDNRVSGGGNIQVACDTPALVRLRGNVVTGSRVAGMAIVKGGRVRVEGGALTGNRASGLFAAPGTRVELGSVRFGGNGGLGFDVAPSGPTANAARKLANDDLDWPEALKYDRKKGRLSGAACVKCRVEIWEAEDGDEHGEGLRVIKRVTSGPDGKFDTPLDCPASGRVAVTVTRPGRARVTSEFSNDVECACVIHQEFLVDLSTVPNFGFRGFGIGVWFRKGTKPEPGVLIDTATEKPPKEGALGGEVRWSQTQGQVRGGTFAIPEGSVGYDYAVLVADANVPDRTPKTGRYVWRWDIAYEPPKGAASCGAVVHGVTDPPPQRKKK